jgi:hypothetical protein
MNCHQSTANSTNGNAGGQVTRAIASAEGRTVTRFARLTTEQTARPRGRRFLKAGGDGWWRRRWLVAG